MSEKSIRWRRVVPVAALALATAAGIAAAPTAAADPLGAAAGAKGAPAAAPATEPACTLTPSLVHPQGEHTSCLAVGVRLSRLPAVGETATVTVTVKADRSEPATDVSVDLPSTLVFADGTAASAAVTGSGPVARATVARYALAKGDTRTVTRTVRAVASGFGGVTARASNRLSAARTDGGADSLFLTVGATTGSSRLGGGAASTAATTHSVRAGSKATVTEVHGKITAIPAPVRPKTQATARPATAGTSCATGTWNFHDQNGTSVGAHNVTVQVRNSANTVLASAFSGGDGSYNICWNTGGATTQAYVQFREDNNVWTLHDLSDNIFNYSTGVTAVADGTTWNLGALYPGNSADNPGLHAFQEADNEFQWMYEFTPYLNGCWSPLESTCRQLVIHWQSDNTTQGTNWNQNTGVFLLAGSPNTLDEPAHEYGHALMFNLYGQNFPATTNCATHDLFVTSSTTCAWTEGWADWVATSVYNNMVWTYNGGGQRDMNQTWNDPFGYPDGDQVEARVVQAMRSLTDGAKYPFDNDPGEGGGVADAHLFFTILHNYHPNTFADVWNDRAAAGQDTSQTALSALYQGTIDYGFRNPLADGVGKVLPQAVPPHNYSFTTTRGYWSAVAVRPVADGASDTDLGLYSDFGQGSLLTNSGYGSSSVDFVAINSNSGAQPLQTYYPRASRFSGTGGYTIEGVQGATTFSSGTTTVATGSTQPIDIMDSSQTTGVPVFYRAVPLNGQSVGLTFLQPGGTVVARSTATNSAVGMSGQAVSLSVTPTASGFGGLVLVNQGLTSGSVTLYADTSAPTGSVSINGGAKTAASTTVALTLSGTDAQTGVDAMQISTDGTFDTEPVVAYASTASATLDGANGVKTVYVRYRNNAGMWSAPVTDTIKLAASPGLTSLTPTSGPAAGGTTVTLTGVRFTGATGVKFGGAAGTNVTVVNDRKLTVQVPAHAGAGAVTVKVTNANGTSTDAVSYTYTAPPTVTALSKTSGPAAGGSGLKITGTGFTGATVVKFGTTAATSFTVDSPTQITVVTPAHAAGKVDVTVKGPLGTSAVSAADQYTFS